jgi:hypothetical protein
MVLPINKVNGIKVFTNIQPPSEWTYAATGFLRFEIPMDSSFLSICTKVIYPRLDSIHKCAECFVISPPEHRGEPSMLTLVLHYYDGFEEKDINSIIDTLTTWLAKDQFIIDTAEYLEILAEKKKLYDLDTGDFTPDELTSHEIKVSEINTRLEEYDGRVCLSLL